MLAVESLRAPDAGPAGPAASSDGTDVLVLRLGRAPVPGEEPPAAGPTSPSAPAGTTPPSAEAGTAAPAMSPDQYYVVQPGDTLSSIAKEKLGSALLAGELARINRLDDPNQLQVGQILYLH